MPRRPLEIHILRRADQEKQRFPTQFELVLQTYVMPLADFVQAAPGFDPDAPAIGSVGVRPACRGHGSCR